MVYVWKDENTGIEVEVERPMRDYKKAPKQSEIQDTEMTSDQFATAKWSRVIGGGSMLINFNNKGSYGKV